MASLWKTMQVRNATWCAHCYLIAHMWTAHHTPLHAIPAGAFPLWLAPVQVALLPVVAEVEPFAAQLAARLNALGLRAEVQAGQRIGKLIRNAETSKVPVMCVVGKKEV